MRDGHYHYCCNDSCNLVSRSSPSYGKRIERGSGEWPFVPRCHIWIPRHWNHSIKSHDSLNVQSTCIKSVNFVNNTSRLQRGLFACQSEQIQLAVAIFASMSLDCASLCGGDTPDMPPWIMYKILSVKRVLVVRNVTFNHAPVEPLNNGHVGGRIFVLGWEVPISGLLANHTPQLWGCIVAVRGVVCKNLNQQPRADTLTDENRHNKGANVLSRCCWVAVEILMLISHFYPRLHSVRSWRLFCTATCPLEVHVLSVVRR